MAASSVLSSEMRSRILRRSSSTEDSPAPLSPMPPRWRSPPPVSRNRGATYVSRAISTCRRAGRLDACRWKISMITPVRSRTAAAEVARSMWRSWRGDSSWSMTTTVARGSPVGVGSASRCSASVLSSSSSSSVAFFLPGGPLGTTPVPPVQAASSTSLPSPSSVAAPRPLRFCVTSPTTSKPSVSHRRLSSFSEDRCSASATPESCTPTSTALGRGASVGADMIPWLALYASTAHAGIPAGFGGTPGAVRMQPSLTEDRRALPKYNKSGGGRRWRRPSGPPRRRAGGCYDAPVSGEPHIRKVRPDDLEEVWRVHVASSSDLAARRGRPAARPADAPVASDARAGLASDPDGYFCAVEEGRIRGMVSALIRGRVWYLSMFFVLPGDQGRGVGRALLERALAYGEARGAEVRCTWATLDPRAQARYVMAGMAP